MTQNIDDRKIVRSPSDFQNDFGELQTPDNNTLTAPFAPNVKGEQSVSGTTPDPSSDDDTLANAHDMGIGLGEDAEHPQDLNIAKDMADAEAYRRSH